MLRVVESRNIGFGPGFLSLLQNPEIRVFKSLARVIDLSIAHFDSNCGHFEIFVPKYEELKRQQEPRESAIVVRKWDVECMIAAFIFRYQEDVLSAQPKT